MRLMAQLRMHAAIHEVRSRAMVDQLTLGLSKEKFFNAIKMERRLRAYIRSLKIL